MVYGHHKAYNYNKATHPFWGPHCGWVSIKHYSSAMVAHHCAVAVDRFLLKMAIQLFHQRQNQIDFAQCAAANNIGNPQWVWQWDCVCVSTVNISLAISKSHLQATFVQSAAIQPGHSLGVAVGWWLKPLIIIHITIYMIAGAGSTSSPTVGCTSAQCSRTNRTNTMNRTTPRGFPRRTSRQAAIKILYSSCGRSWEVL